MAVADSAAAAAGAAGAAAAGSGEGAASTLSLRHALALRWAQTDTWVLPLIAIIELAVLVTGLLHGVVTAAGVGSTAVTVGLNLLPAALAAHRPRRYSARWRLPLILATRAAGMMLFPTAVDLLSVMAGQPVPAGAAAAAAAAAAAGKPLAGSWSAAAALLARGAAFFVIPLAGVHACLLTALYSPLPPLAHLAVQMLSVGFLMRRAPSVCGQFVAMHPLHARLAEAAYFVARHVVALLCPGTWPTLEAVAEEASPVEKCVAVAWTLEVSLGLMLATLLAWQQQLREAQEVAARKALVSEEAAVEARAELLCSPYVRVCEPALEVADIYGTWAVPLGLSALAAFIAALPVRPAAVGF